MKLIIKKINPNIITPSYGSKSAAGLDICAYGEYIIPAGTRKLISTGISIQWIKNSENDDDPNKFYLRIADRSGNAYKKGITCLGGVIDEDYRGEIKVILLNTSDEDFIINDGDRICQGILTRIEVFNEIVLSDTLTNTDRGSEGFGSTGV